MLFLVFSHKRLRALLAKGWNSISLLTGFSKSDSLPPNSNLEVMMSSLFWLSDEAWAAIEPHLPRNQPGARRVNDRRVISGILHVLKTGCRWRDCPKEYGPHTTVYNRFNRWSRRRLWTHILEVLVGAGVLMHAMAIDSTYIKAHRSAHGGKGGQKRRLSAPPVVGKPRKST